MEAIFLWIKISKLSTPAVNESTRGHNFLNIKCIKIFGIGKYEKTVFAYYITLHFWRYQFLRLVNVFSQVYAFRWS